MLNIASRHCLSVISRLCTCRCRDDTTTTLEHHLSRHLYHHPSQFQVLDSGKGGVMC